MTRWAARSASRSRRTGRCWSPTTSGIQCGEWVDPAGPDKSQTPNPKSQIKKIPTPRRTLGFGFWDLGFGISLLRRARRRLQHQLLHAPVGELADENPVRIPAVDLVNRPELLHLLAALAEAPDDLAVQLHLVDLAVVEVADRVRVGAEEVLMGAR